MASPMNATATPSGWALFQHSPLTVSATTATALAILYLTYLALLPQRKSTDIRKLGGFSILTAWPFFTKRHDFLKSNFAKIGEQLFTFNVLQVNGMRLFDVKGSHKLP